MEVPSEDPFHSGQYGVAYTKGLQWGDDPRYTKAIGALKHYTIYSVENSGGVEGGGGQRLGYRRRWGLALPKVPRVQHAPNSSQLPWRSSVSS